MGSVIASKGFNVLNSTLVNFIFDEFPFGGYAIDWHPFYEFIFGVDGVGGIRFYEPIFGICTKNRSDFYKPIFWVDAIDGNSFNEPICGSYAKTRNEFFGSNNKPGVNKPLWRDTSAGSKVFYKSLRSNTTVKSDVFCEFIWSAIANRLDFYKPCELLRRDPTD